MDRLAVASDVLFKAPQGELEPGSPVRGVCIDGRFGNAGRGLERPAALAAVAGLGRPDVAVHPEAVDFVAVDQLHHLGNEQLFEIRRAGAHLAGHALAGGVHAAPGAVFLAGGIVPDTGVMAVEGQIQLAGRPPPALQCVLFDARADRSIGDFAEPAGISGMAFAVGLNEVDAQTLEHGHQILVVGAHAQLGVVGTCVQVVVQTEVALLAVPPAGVDRHIVAPHCMGEKEVGIIFLEITSVTMGPLASVRSRVATHSGSARKASQLFS